MMGTAGREGRSSSSSGSRSGKSGTVISPSAPGSGWMFGGRSSCPGVRFGTSTSGAPSIGGKSMIGGRVPVGGLLHSRLLDLRISRPGRLALDRRCGDGRAIPRQAGKLHHRVALGLRPAAGGTGRVAGVALSSRRPMAAFPQRRPTDCARPLGSR